MFNQRLRRLWAAISTLVLLSLLGVALPPASADCAGNALVNGGFEGGFSTRGAGEVEVAVGWTPYYQDGPFTEDGYNRRPEYKPENANIYGTRRVREGTYAQKWGSVYATHKAGIYQQVNVTVGSSLTLTAWAQSWSSTKDDPAVSDGGNYSLSVGIDPTGGTDYASANVVWSAQSTTLDAWVQLTVQTTAQAGTVTVFLRGDSEWRNKHNDAYFDDVCLTVTAPTPKATNTPRNTNTPTITPTPSNTPTATPTETPTPTPTPLSGSITVYAFEDGDSNGARSKSEPLLAGAKIVVSDAQGSAVATYTTTGAGEPHTFEFLPVGSYTVTETDPTGYTSTSPNEKPLVIEAGANIEVPFADLFLPTRTPTFTPTATEVPAATPVPSATPFPTALPAQNQASGGLANVSGILVVLAIIVLVVALRFAKKRA